MRYPHPCSTTPAPLLLLLVTFGTFGLSPLQAAIPSSHKIMAFGDSITRGYGDDHGDGTTVLCDETGGYPDRLRALLAAQGVTTTVNHSAVCGELTAEGLSRIDSSLTLIQPEVTLIMEGTNDFSQPGLISIETIVANIDAMATKVSARGGVPVVITPPPRDPEVVNPEFEVDARAAFFATALGEHAALEQLNFVDLYQTFVDLEVEDLFAELYFDPYHPNADGYDLIAETFRDPTLAALDQVLYPFACRDGEEKICLADNTFQVEVTWKTRLGETGRGKAIRLTGDTAYFWFFNSDNVELVIKVLDANTINQKYWVFYGALSDVEYTITVTDSRSGRAKLYRNEQGTLASLGDTSAFPGTVGNNPPTVASSLVRGFALASLPAEDESANQPGGARAACVQNDTTVCLNRERFAVKVNWSDPQGQRGQGHATRLTADTGYFWFFNSSNIELMLKVLDGRNLNGHYWVFFGSLTNVQFTAEVYDTVGDKRVTYENPQGQMASVADTAAFQVPPSP